MVSVDELQHKLKIKYQKKNQLVNQINEIKLDIEALEIMLEVEIKKLKGE